ncbi:MAG: NAD/NADP octopine/nopaline dehydrogenase family protein [Anaerolineae bacterium]|nr:NAD/NADP octopine/nopaline dehydrogenase family protein [Anaerolineae bacterium]
MSRIAILGAGNGGCAAAADLTLRGHSVALYDLPEFAHVLKPIQERGGIEIIGEGFAEIDTVTSDIAEAMRGAEYVFNPVPAFAHEIFARTCAPYVEDGQTIIVWGKGGACLIYGKVFRDAGVTADVALGDTNTLPYGATKMEPTLVRIEARVMELITAAFPGRLIDRVINALKTVFPEYSIRPARSVLESILVDYNAITHPPPMICNAARIERGDPTFCLFDKTANTPAVVNLIKLVDRERMALSEALGIKAYTLEEEIYNVGWNPKGREDEGVLPLYDAIHTENLEICEGPFKLDTRHLTEDIPYGLFTYCELGRMLDVPTPVSSAIVTIASGLLDRDFYAEGRSLDKLGFDSSWSVERLYEYLENGK